MFCFTEKKVKKLIDKEFKKRDKVMRENIMRTIIKFGEESEDIREALEKIRKTNRVRVGDY